MVDEFFQSSLAITQVTCEPDIIGSTKLSTQATRPIRQPKATISGRNRSSGLVSLIASIYVLTIFLTSPIAAQLSTLDIQANTIAWGFDRTDIKDTMVPDYWTFSQCVNPVNNATHSTIREISQANPSVTLHYNFEDAITVESVFLLFGDSMFSDSFFPSTNGYSVQMQRGTGAQKYWQENSFGSGFFDLSDEIFENMTDFTITITGVSSFNDIHVAAVHLYSSSNIIAVGNDNYNLGANPSPSYMYEQSDEQVGCITITYDSPQVIDLESVKQVQDLLIVGSPSTELFDSPYTDYVTDLPQDKTSCTANTAYFSNFKITVQAEATDALRTFTVAPMTSSSENVATIIGNNWQLNQRAQIISIVVGQNSPPVRICHLGVMGTDAAYSATLEAKADAPELTIIQIATEEQAFTAQVSIGIYEYSEQCVQPSIVSFTVEGYGSDLQIVGDSEKRAGSIIQTLRIDQEYSWKAHSRYNSTRVVAPQISVQLTWEATQGATVSCSEGELATTMHDVSFSEGYVAYIGPQETEISINDEEGQAYLENPTFPWELTVDEVHLTYAIELVQFSQGRTFDSQCWRLNTDDPVQVYVEINPSECEPALEVDDFIQIQVTREYTDLEAADRSEKAQQIQILKLIIVDEIVEYDDDNDEQQQLVDEQLDIDLIDIDFLGDEWWLDEDLLGLDLLDDDMLDEELLDEELFDLDLPDEEWLDEELFDLDLPDEEWLDGDYTEEELQELMNGEERFDDNHLNDLVGDYADEYGYDHQNDDHLYIDPSYEERRKEEQEQSEVVGRHFDPNLLAELQARVFRTNNHFKGVDINEIDEEREDIEVEEPEDIVPVIKELNAAGELQIDFDPPNASVPDSWDALWDQEKRASMTEGELKFLDSLVSEIFQVVFVQNSDESPQSFFGNKIGTFSPSGLKVQLDFSDPLLISQGDVPDKVKIRLLKSFFTDNKGQDNRRRKRRRLQTEEDLYHIFQYDVPKQVKSKEELVSLQETGEAAQTAVAGQLVTSIILNIVLSGTLSQLWNIFNTMQLLTALPMFSINTPGNVITMNDAFAEISNFKIVEKEQLYDWVVVPVFGTSTSEEKAIADGVIGSTEKNDAKNNSTDTSIVSKPKKEDLEENSEEVEEASYLEQAFAGTTLIMNILVIILVLILFGSLIALLVLCRNLVKAKGCKLAQTALRKAESKLMFNSVLRAALESYFLVCIGTIYAVIHPKFDKGEDNITFAISLAILTYLIVFPIAQHKFLIKKFKTLGEEVTKDKYGSLYQNVNVNKKHSLRFTLYFCARRFAFALTIVLLKDSIVLQILAGDAAILGMLSFYVAGAPMLDKFNNFIQIFNEIIVCLALASLVLFTDFIGDPVERYEWGYTLLKLIAASVMVNVFILLATIVFVIYNAIRKLFFKRKIAKKMKELEAKKVALMKKNDGKATVEDNKRKPKRTKIELEAIVEEEDYAESDRRSEQEPSKRTMASKPSPLQKFVLNHQLSSSSSSSGEEKPSPRPVPQGSSKNQNEIKSESESEASEASQNESDSSSVESEYSSVDDSKEHRYQGSDASVNDVVQEPVQAINKKDKVTEEPKLFIATKASSHYKNRSATDTNYDPAMEQSVLDDGSLAMFSDTIKDNKIAPRVFEVDEEDLTNQANRKARRVMISALLGNDNAQKSKN